MQLNLADTAILDYVHAHPGCDAREVIDQVDCLADAQAGYQAIIPLVGSGLLHWGSEANRACLTVTDAGRAAMGMAASFEVSFTLVITPANWYKACRTTDVGQIIADVTTLARQSIEVSLSAVDNTGHIEPIL